VFLKKLKPWIEELSLIPLHKNDKPQDHINKYYTSYNWDFKKPYKSSQIYSNLKTWFFMFWVKYEKN